MCLTSQTSLFPADNNPLLSPSAHQNLAFSLVDNFGPEVGMRLLLDYIRRRCEAWKKYDMKREVLKYEASKSRNTACSKIPDEKRMTVLRSGEQDRRGRGWREFWHINWLSVVMRKRIATDSHDPQADMERIKVVLVEDLQRLDNEYIIMLEQKARENEVVRVFMENQATAMSQLERSIACLRTYRNNLIEEIQFSKYKL
ncbi:hypothetical protein E4U43_003029 [Claviceps pusilla]|uniref:Uncharacterized protein n=1 Tax=Claviceps pusilla TaxID=123648 RepID=A0A9P7N5A7_9HYPO|nr:hypothetical protein E4U43_003029 [Claviceps pusilla]